MKRLRFTGQVDLGFFDLIRDNEGEPAGSDPLIL